MKKKRVIAVVIGFAVVIVALATVIMYNDTESYDNFFQYAINLEHEKYTYAPKQVDFFMSMEEVLQAEGISRDAVLEDKGVILEEKAYTDVSEEIPELTFGKMFSFEKELGLVNVTYNLIVEDTYLEGLCKMLYEQAVAYNMPEGAFGTSVELIKDGKRVDWNDSVFDEKNGWSTVQSEVSFSVGNHHDGRKVVKLSVSLNPQFLKENMISSQEKTVEYVEQVASGTESHLQAAKEELTWRELEGSGNLLTDIFWSVKNSLLIESDPFYVSEGQTISISGFIAPEDKEVKVGICNSEGSKYYIYAESSYLHEFQIEKAGNYWFLLENTKDTPVTVAGQIYIRVTS